MKTKKISGRKKAVGLIDNSFQGIKEQVCRKCGKKFLGGTGSKHCLDCKKYY